LALAVETVSLKEASGKSRSRVGACAAGHRPLESWYAAGFLGEGRRALAEDLPLARDPFATLESRRVENLWPSAGSSKLLRRETKACDSRMLI